MQEAIKREANLAYPGASFNWDSLECVSHGGRTGSCFVYGDLSAPNSSTSFVITVSSPGFADCDYENQKIEIQAVNGEC